MCKSSPVAFLLRFFVLRIASNLLASDVAIDLRMRSLDSLNFATLSTAVQHLKAITCY